MNLKQMLITDKLLNCPACKAPRVNKLSVQWQYDCKNVQKCMNESWEKFKEERRIKEMVTLDEMEQM